MINSVKKKLLFNKKILFLASSEELKEDRKEFEILINRKNDKWIDKGYFLKLVVWEYFLGAMSKTRLQDEYNKVIRNCDIFIMLFCTKIGKYTEEEFDIAYNQFKKTGKPLIYIYFNESLISANSANQKEDLQSLFTFQDKLKKRGHFYTVYKNRDELTRKFYEQLDLLETQWSSINKGVVFLVIIFVSIIASYFLSKQNSLNHTPTLSKTSKKDTQTNIHNDSITSTPSSTPTSVTNPADFNYDYSVMEQRQNKPRVDEDKVKSPIPSQQAPNKQPERSTASVIQDELAHAKNIEKDENVQKKSLEAAKFEQNLSNAVAQTTIQELSKRSAIESLGVNVETANIRSPFTINQGPNWTPEARKSFYSQDQGSQMMPLNWFQALKQSNGQPFMAESLSRYGYLPNEDSNIPGLPVGFTTTTDDKSIGMTCSACHTRQIEVAGVPYRIDGGPAIVNFQGFLSDLDDAVNAILKDDKAFADFANAVLGTSTSPDKVKQLHEAVSAWYLRYDTLIKASLPTDPWGPSRADAVTMIFNRLTGLDIGPPPTYMIPENIKRADVPVRYPFLWNAPIQDKTQWPGFADNGDRILGVSRNLGEVFGVFAVFHPKKDTSRLMGIDYLAVNSANFAGLEKQEELIKKLGPPKWPWAVDKDLAAKGKVIYTTTCAAGCHEIKKGAVRSLTHKTWATPIQDVGTDSREYDVLAGMVDTGVLNGANIPFIDNPLKPQDKAFSVLGAAVTGTIIQQVESMLPGAERVSAKDKQKIKLAKLLLRPGLNHLGSLKGAFRMPTVPVTDAAPVFAYESRVLEGIWATAPYLHNGSVPTLAELLKPVAERVSSFKIGPVYDTNNVGLAVEQSKFDYTLKTTDCSNRNSGNSRCGHEFGTTLSPEDKKALLEYLKIL